MNSSGPYGMQVSTYSETGTAIEGKASINGTEGPTYGLSGINKAEQGAGVLGGAEFINDWVTFSASYGIVGYNKDYGPGVGAWSYGGDLFKGYSGIYPEGDLKFIVSNDGDISIPDGHLNIGSLAYSSAALKVNSKANYQVYTLGDLASPNDSIGLFVSEAGHVGIGTTDLSNSKLQVQGTGSFGATLRLVNASTGGADFFMASTADTWGLGGHKFVLGHGTPNSTNADVCIESDGHVGIGSTAVKGVLDLAQYQGGTAGSYVENYSHQLVLGGAYGEGANETGVKLWIGDYDNDGTIVYPIYCEDENNGVDFFIKNRTTATGDPIMYFAGKVAINTGNPSELLDVNGNARFRAVASGTYSKALNLTSDGTLTYSTSDIRLKTHIETINDGLDRIMKLRGVRFNWKTDPDGKKMIGFIAQEVEKVVPELVFTNEADGYMGLNYAEMTAVLAEAVKEQQQIIETQRAQNEQLKKMLEALEQRVAALETK